MSSLIHQINHAVSAYYPVGHVAVYVLAIILVFVVSSSFMLAINFDSKSLNQREPVVFMINHHVDTMFTSPKPWELNYRRNIPTLHQKYVLLNHHYHNLTGKQVLHRARSIKYKFKKSQQQVAQPKPIYGAFWGDFATLFSLLDSLIGLLLSCLFELFYYIGDN